MRDVPWRTIAELVLSTMCANQGTGHAFCVRHVCACQGAAIVKSYLEKWKREIRLVEYVLTWSRCSPEDMCEASRPGAWLADVVYTVMLVELGFARPNVKYIPV